MLKLNDVVLTNDEIIKRLGKKIDGQIEFCLMSSMSSQVRLLNDQNEARWETKYPASFGLNNQHTCRNFDTGGQETYVYYTNVVGDANKGFRYHTAQDLNKIQFNNGYLIVKAGQEDLLLFLRVHEQNQTNEAWSVADRNSVQKNRPQKAFLFKEIIPIREAEIDYERDLATLKAQAFAYHPEKLPYLKALDMAIGYGMANANYAGEKAVRVFLRNRAAANPIQFMKDVESVSFEIKAKVQQAINLGIIQFDSPYVKWNTNTNGDTRICIVPAGQDFTDYFVHWMREVDKTDVLSKIDSQILTYISKKDMLEIQAKESDYEGLLKHLGVKSIDEAKQLISSAKDKEDEGEDKETEKRKAGRPKTVITQE